ncbi:MAG: hypothetical protein V4580_13065 [Bacteroidota bacterium]
MKIYLQIIGLVIIIALLSSCATTMYTTNAVNVPLLKEKGEVKINVTQNDLQAAVAVTDKIGIIANGFYKNYDGDNNYRHSGGMGEAGIGYLLNRENLMIETYIGGGVGKVHKQQQFSNPDNTTYMANFDANAAKGFIQSNFGLRSKYFDVALTPKFSFVKYSNFTYSNYTEGQLKDDYLNNNRVTDPLYVFAEPAITVRGGYKFIKLQAQYGLTVNLGGQSIRHTPDFASLGLVIDIAKWYKD